jgi:hypothetical protein
MNRTNELISFANLATEGQLNTSGTIKITNPSLLDGGVSLNVANGMIKGDGGLLYNVTPVIANSSISNIQLANPYVRIISNSSTLSVSGGNNANLGTTVYFDIGTLSIRANDTSIANIASANVVNIVNQLAIAAYDAANTGASAGPAFNKANAANVLASAAFDAANTAGNGYFKGNRGTVGNANNVGDIFRINDQFISSNITINANERGLAVGPLTVNSGITLTVSSGGRVVII